MRNLKGLPQGLRKNQRAPDHPTLSMSIRVCDGAMATQQNAMVIAIFAMIFAIFAL